MCSLPSTCSFTHHSAARRSSVASVGLEVVGLFYSLLAPSVVTTCCPLSQPPSSASRGRLGGLLQRAAAVAVWFPGEE
jgi:hypothetical protein